MNPLILAAKRRRLADRVTCGARSQPPAGLAANLPTERRLRMCRSAKSPAPNRRRHARCASSVRGRSCLSTWASRTESNPQGAPPGTPRRALVAVAANRAERPDDGRYRPHGRRPPRRRGSRPRAVGRRKIGSGSVPNAQRARPVSRARPSVCTWAAAVVLAVPVVPAVPGGRPRPTPPRRGTCSPRP